MRSGWWNFTALSLSRNNIFKGKTAPLNSYILGFASHHRLKCVRSQIPPRRPASFIQLVWHKPVSCTSLSLNITVSLPICLAWDWRVCTDLASATSFSRASCLQRIHFWRKSPVRHPFWYLFHAVPVTIYFTVKMSRDAIGCCPAIAS